MSNKTTNAAALAKFEDAAQLEEQNHFEVYLRKEDGTKRLVLTFELNLLDKYETCLLLKLDHFEISDIQYWHNDEVKPYHLELNEFVATKSKNGFVLDGLCSDCRVIICAFRPLAEPIQIHDTFCTHVGLIWYFQRPHWPLEKATMLPMYLGKR